MKNTIKKMIMVVVIVMMTLGATTAAYADYDDWDENWDDEDWEDDDWEEDDDDDEKDGWYQDEDGYWHYNTGRYDAHNEIKEIDGKKYYFNSRGRMSTNILIYQTDIGYSTTYYYFGADGAMATGWIQDSTGNWLYALPYSGEVLKKGIIYDDGLYYIIDKCYMVTGAYNMDWERKEYYDFDDSNTGSRIKPLPYAIGWGTVDMGTGGVTLERLPKSNGMPSEVVDELSRQYFGDGGGSNNNTNNAEVFSVTDNYIAVAMAEKGYYSYEVISRESVSTAAFGGYTAVYKVKVSKAGSYHTGYLRITINTYGQYVSSSF